MVALLFVIILSFQGGSALFSLLSANCIRARVVFLVLPARTKCLKTRPVFLRYGILCILTPSILIAGLP